MYEYRCLVTRVIDGDSLVAVIDLGFRMSYTTTVRLAGLSAPELNTGEHGAYAKAKLADWVLEKPGVTVRTTKHREFEKYGRVLGTFVIDGVNVNQKMIDDGYAAPMKG